MTTLKCIFGIIWLLQRGASPAKAFIAEGKFAADPVDNCCLLSSCFALSHFVDGQAFVHDSTQEFRYCCRHELIVGTQF
jgi:hypothetical protein